MRAPLAWAAGLIDIVLVAAFVLIGRGSHDEGFGFTAVIQTLWPFAVGLLVGWLAARAWRRPFSVARTGVVVWVATVAIGMVLRLVSAQGTQLAFVIVATLTLAVFLIGWRVIWSGVRRLRAGRHARASRE